MTTTGPTARKRQWEITDIDIDAISGVHRGANRTQLRDVHGNPIDGWAVMKADGTLVERVAGSGSPAEPSGEPAHVDQVADAVLEYSSKADAHDAMAAKADEIRRSDPTLTFEQAFDRAYVDNPSIVAAYRAAPDVERAPVERAAPAELPGAEYVQKIDALADAHQARTGATRDAAYTEVLKTSEGSALALQYKAANGW